MKERKIKLIIVVIAVALISLIVIQGYWISNAFLIQKLRFNNNVREALNSFSSKLEKQSVLPFVINKIDKPLNDSVKITVHSAKIPGDKHKLKFFNESARVILKKESSGNSDVKLTVSTDSAHCCPDSLIKVFIKTDKTNPQKYFRSKIDTIIQKKRIIVEEVLNDIILFDKGIKIDERFDEKSVELMLGKSLEASGIKLKFGWGIFDEKHGKIILTNDRSNIEDIRKSEYSLSIMNDSFLDTQIKIKLFFRDKESYLLSSVLGVLSISVIIVLIIILLFYQTVYMLIKQKKISEVKNDLIKNLTHEFNTPLSTIEVAVDSIKNPDFDKGNLEKYLTIIADEKNRLKSMIEILLTTARLEKESLFINRENVNIHDLLSEAIEKTGMIYKSAEPEFVTHFNAEAFLISADRAHILNVFMNILSNSIKYSAEKPLVSVSTSISDDKVQISFKDNGIGIPKKYLTRIFDTFFRVPTGDQHNQKGYGIGLSYSKKVVLAHHGEIEVKSKTNSGSTFIIKLPLD